MPIIADFLMKLVLISDIALVALMLDALAVKIKLKKRLFSAWEFLGKNALWFGLLVSLVSMLVSLYYSDILKFEPCVLCWYQRIAMYPQVALFAVALWKREPFRVWTYSAVLSVIGALIAGFQYYGQMVANPVVSLPCQVLEYSTSCASTFAPVFGYITIPMMALTGFVMLLALKALSEYTFERKESK
ncbi:MAG TPA: disulfide bond formation protein B [Candidatus Nanoarchaeia archaeon]|nr:disulfide bond formation protein B [Candidatus Nanoarchaeia archaeon]